MSHRLHRRNKNRSVFTLFSATTRIAAGFTAVVIVLAGCTAYRAQPIDVTQASQAFASRSLDDPELQAELAKVLPEDEQLDVRNKIWGTSALFVAAMHFNPSLREARAHIAAATSGVTTAKALPDVAINLGSEFDLERGAESPWLWSISTNFLLDAVLRQRLRTELAQTTVRIARLDYAEAIWTMRRELHSALLSAVIAERRIALLSNVEQDRAILVRLMKQRVAAGEAAPTESVQAELEASREHAAKATAQRELTDARAHLAGIVGVPISALDNVQLRWSDMEQPSIPDEASLQALRQKTLLSRPDLERAIVEYQAREVELHQQLRAQYPQVSIGPGYTWDHGVRKATLGLSLSLPLLSRNRGPIAEAMARRETAGQHLLGVQAQVFNDIDAGRRAFREAMDALNVAKQQSTSAQSLVARSGRAVELGAEDRATLVTARVTATIDALAELDAIDRAQQALAQWENALRTPLAGLEASLGLSSITPNSVTP